MNAIVRGWLCVAALAATTSVTASERATVCAHYQTDDGWSEGYKVEATIAKGTDLNQATSSYNYNGWSQYVVIFWGQDQATVIELDDPYLSSLDSDGKDQQGRRWRVAKTSFCF